MALSLKYCFTDFKHCPNVVESMEQHIFGELITLD